MIRRALLFGVPALATVALLALPSLSQAQMMTIPGNMGRGGGYYGGSGWGGGYNSGWGGYANPGYYNRGGYANPGYYSGWSGYANPGYSSGTSYYNYPNYSYYSSPGYYNQGYSSGYSTYPGGNYYSQGTGYSGYQSFYPSNPNANQSAYVRLQVPPDAEVWFDGQKTQQTGADRLYVSPPLDRNKSYTYEIKARWMENGQPVERTKKVNVQAGTQATESFQGQSEEQPRRDTSGTRDDTRIRPVGAEPATRTPASTDVNRETPPQPRPQIPPSR